MAVRALPVAITTTPIAVLDAATSIDGASGSFTNVGGTTVYVGGDDMTSANAATHGYPIAPGGGIDDMNLLSGETLFGVMLAGTGTLAVLSTGVK